MNLGGRDIDTDEENSGSSCQRRGDSHAITEALRIVMPPARDRVDGHTARGREIVGKDIGVRRPLRFPDLQLPGHGTEQIIGSTGTADRLVGIEYELTADGAAEKRAEAGRALPRLRIWRRTRHRAWPATRRQAIFSEVARTRDASASPCSGHDRVGREQDRPIVYFRVQ